MSERLSIDSLQASKDIEIGNPSVGILVEPVAVIIVINFSIVD